ncbi:MAG: mycothiol system anti-sigma-R factor [Egibacteraceae bacterium]
MDERCHDLLVELDRFLDGECPKRVEHALREHLQECEPCFDRTDFEQHVRALVAEHCREDRAPHRLVAQILTRLQVNAS